MTNSTRQLKDAKPVTVNVLRYDPDKGEGPYWQSYEVPRRRATRVLDVLEYIQDELDPTLGYRRHICRNLSCRSCFVEVDGHSRMTCQSVIRQDTDVIRLEPMSDFAVVRDLIVDFSRAK
jgi:fumarate reductase iron-sulfur subunit